MWSKGIKYGRLKEALGTCDKCQNLMCWLTCCVFQIQISFKRGDRVMAKYWEDGLVSFSSILSLLRIVLKIACTKVTFLLF